MDVVSTAAILIKQSTKVTGSSTQFPLPCYDGFDSVLFIRRSNDKPKEHICHVDQPNGLFGFSAGKLVKEMEKSYTIEIQSISKHQFPGRQGLLFEGIDGAHEGENELYHNSVTFS